MTDDSRPVVLVATGDDDAGTRFVDSLSGTYAVRRADSVAGALAAVDGDVAAALLDRDLAATAQREVIAALREGGENPRVAAVTDDDPDFDVIETGFDGHVPREMGGEDLRATVEDLLAGREFVDRVEEYRSLVADQAAGGVGGDPGGDDATVTGPAADDADLDEEIEAVDEELAEERERLADDAELVATLRELTGDGDPPEEATDE